MDFINQFLIKILILDNYSNVCFEVGEVSKGLYDIVMCFKKALNAFRFLKLTVYLSSNCKYCKLL